MANRPPSPDRRSPTLSQLESAIFSAGSYVQPTDNLRPRTLEAASERGARQQGRRWVLGLAALLLLAPALPALAIQTWGARPVSFVSAADLHERARQISQQGNVQRSSVDAGWGLFEAFLLMRREQAMQFGAGPSGVGQGGK